MNRTLFCAFALASLLTGPARAGGAPSDAAIRDLASGGTLRVAVAVGPDLSAFRAVRDPATGAPKGVAVDLAKALAGRLGVPLQLVPFAAPGAIVDTAAAGAWDIAFLPADVERAREVDFSVPYYLVEGTLLVRSGGAVRNGEPIDRRGIRVAVIAKSATMHMLARKLKMATIVPFGTEKEVEAAFVKAQVDVVAMGREPLERIAKSVPGSRLVDSKTRASGVGIAVPKNHSAGLAYLTQFIEEAKASGAVQQALESAGISSGIVAPSAAAN